MTHVPNIANWGVLASLHILMLATVAAADRVSTVRKKDSALLHIAKRTKRYVRYIYKQTRTLCVLQYSNRNVNKNIVTLTSKQEF